MGMEENVILHMYCDCDLCGNKFIARGHDCYSADTVEECLVMARRAGWVLHCTGCFAPGHYKYREEVAMEKYDPKKHNRYFWMPWFAWHPVRLRLPNNCGYGWVWLRTVERRLYETPGTKRWIYRVPANLREYFIKRAAKARG